jgi:bifunctional oligoribonuclease and PAP phosphatase NrnA
MDHRCLFIRKTMGISMQAAGEALRDLVKGLKGRKVAVLGHMRPDGDCIGSQTALCRMLLAEGVDALCVNRDRIPPNLVPYAEGVTFVKGADYDATDRVAVTVDCADASRIGTELLAKFPSGILANIDHHASNPDYAQTNIVVREAAATCHILAAGALAQGLAVDTVTAKALHLGILTDTGRFCYRSTTADVFAIIAELVRRGADPAEANYRVFEQESRGKLELTKRFLNTILFHEDGKICSGELTQADYAATGTSKEDKEGLVEFPRSVEGVEIAVLMEEGADGIRRGRDPKLRLDLCAGKLNGGGHMLAAGFNMQGCRLPQDRAKILGIVIAHYREYSAK